MRINLTKFTAIIFFAASILHFSLSFSAALAGVTLDFNVASSSNIPESAVADILTSTEPTGLCPRLQNSNSLTADQAQMKVFCDNLSLVNQTQTAPAFKALSARAASSVTSYTANGFYSLNIGDITKRLASLRKSSIKYFTKSASLIDKNQFIVSSTYAGHQLTGGGASADFVEGTINEASNNNDADFISEYEKELSNAPNNTPVKTESNTNIVSNEPDGLTDNRLSGFITGDFVNTEQDETSNLAGYKTGIKSLFIGLHKNCLPVLQ